MAQQKTFLDRVNDTQVTTELLGDVMQMIAELPAETRQSYGGRLVHMFELLKAKGLKGDRHSATAMAINFRLEALARVLGDQAAPGWTLPARDGAEYVPIHMLQAAAELALVEIDERTAGYDVDDFRARVLELSEAKGSS